MAITTTAVSVDEMVEYYHRFLARNGYKGHLKRFSDRLQADPHSARAEAVVFRSSGLKTCILTSLRTTARAAPTSAVGQRPTSRFSSKSHRWTSLQSQGGLDCRCELKAQAAEHTA